MVSCTNSRSKQEFNLRIAVSGKLTPVSSSGANNWSAGPRLMVFEPMLYIDGDGEPKPLLAERIEMLSLRAMRVWLRQGATFSDGTPVTFDNVVPALEEASLKVSREEGALLVESQDSDTAIDARVAEVYIHRQVSGKEIGTGAFTIAEQDEHHIVLHRRAPIPGRVSTVTMVAYETPQQALAHTLKGDADVLPQINPRWVEFLEGVPRLNVSRLRGPFGNAAAFNSARLSRQERVELAKLLRNRQLRTLAFGDECRGPEGEREEQPEVHLSRPKLDVLVYSISGFERFGLAISRALGDRGGDVRVEEADEADKIVKSQNFDMFVLRSRISPTSVAIQQWRTGGTLAGLTHYSNLRLDEAIDARDWPAAKRELEEDPPFAVTCEALALVAMDSRIHNVGSTRLWQNIANWEVEQ